MAAWLMKVLTDENISPRVVSFLRGRGLDTVDVKEKGWQGATDKFLMNAAWEKDDLFSPMTPISELWPSMKEFLGEMMVGITARRAKSENNFDGFY